MAVEIEKSEGGREGSPEQKWESGKPTWPFERFWWPTCEITSVITAESALPSACQRPDHKDAVAGAEYPRWRGRRSLSGEPPVPHFPSRGLGVSRSLHALHEPQQRVLSGCGAEIVWGMLVTDLHRVALALKKFCVVSGTTGPTLNRCWVRNKRQPPPKLWSSLV